MGKLKEKLSNIFKTERAILILCIGIAFFFWLIISLSEPNYTTTYSIPIKYNYPSGLTSNRVLPKQITLDLKSTGWTKLDQPTPIPISFNLDPVENTTITSNIILKAIQQQNNLLKKNIVTMRPSKISYELEESIQKNVIVQESCTITPLKQYVIIDTLSEAKGDSILITGPKSIVKNIAFISSTCTTKKDLQNDITVTSTYELPHPTITLPTANYKTTYIIEEKTSKTILIPIRTPNDSIVVIPQAVKVTVKTSLSYYDEITDKNIIPYIDQPNSNRAKILVKLPQKGILNYQLNVDSVSIQSK